MVICGRKTGKTEFAIDLCWRFGNLINSGQIYYFAAEQTAVKEILWAPERIQGWGPGEYVIGRNNTEMRLTWVTGTFLKADGADNFRGKKGFNPDVVILDEAADYPDSFWHAMTPNFASKDCIVLIITSPPWKMEDEPGKPTLFMRMVEMYKRHPRYFFRNYPTHVNAENLPPGFLEQEEHDLCATGQSDIWEREYLAKFTLSSGLRIIPTFNKDIHMKPHAEVMDKIKKSPVDWDFVTSIDPGSVYAVTFMAINQFTKDVLWLDEIYEKEQCNQMVETLWPRIRKKQIELCGSLDPSRWSNVYDQAAKWFFIEATNRFSGDDEMVCELSPTEKEKNDKNDGLSILRTIFAYGKGTLSDRCAWTAWEFENYRRDDRGNIPKINDHLIDDSRYSLGSVEYFISMEDRPEGPMVPEFYKRQPSLEEDIAKMLAENTIDDIDNFFDNRWERNWDGDGS